MTTGRINQVTTVKSHYMYIPKINIIRPQLHSRCEMALFNSITIGQKYPMRQSDQQMAQQAVSHPTTNDQTETYSVRLNCHCPRDDVSEIQTPKAMAMYKHSQLREISVQTPSANKGLSPRSTLRCTLPAIGNINHQTVRVA